jgi:hypothetical protein
MRAYNYKITTTVTNDNKVYSIRNPDIMTYDGIQETWTVKLINPVIFFQNIFRKTRQASN